MKEVIKKRLTRRLKEENKFSDNALKYILEVKLEIVRSEKGYLS